MKQYEILLQLIGVENIEKTIEQLGRYVQFLIKWNKKTNLISRKSANNIWEEHIVPSLAYSLFMPDDLDYLDVGTGAGLPGLVLKIARPNLSISLLDSNRKKILFCKFIKNEFAFDDLEVYLERAEDHNKTYDAVLFRAVDSIDQLMIMARGLIKENGFLLSLKGSEEVELTRETSIAYEALVFPELFCECSAHLQRSIMVKAPAKTPQLL